MKPLRKILNLIEDNKLSWQGKNLYTFSLHGFAFASVGCPTMYNVAMG